MSNSKRIYTKLYKNDLKQLKNIALNEHNNFFKRNYHLKTAYKNSLIGICLCQGAASHYLNPSIGIKDFDIWYFYIKSRNTNFPYRAFKTIKDGYKGRYVNFLKRAIPKYIYNSYSSGPEQVIMKYLFERNTKTKILLLKKAVIGLYPDEIFGKVLWRGEI